MYADWLARRTSSCFGLNDSAHILDWLTSMAMSNQIFGPGPDPGRSEAVEERKLFLAPEDQCEVELYWSPYIAGLSCYFQSDTAYLVFVRRSCRKKRGFHQDCAPLSVATVPFHHDWACSLYSAISPSLFWDIRSTSQNHGFKFLDFHRISRCFPDVSSISIGCFACEMDMVQFRRLWCIVVCLDVVSLAISFQWSSCGWVSY